MGCAVSMRKPTADTYGGWRAVTNIQAGGGLYAQRIVTRRHYDLDGAKQRADCDSGPDEGNVGHIGCAIRIPECLRRSRGILGASDQSEDVAAIYLRVGKDRDVGRSRAARDLAKIDPACDRQLGQLGQRPAIHILARHIDIDTFRGADSTSVVRQLVRLGLVVDVADPARPGETAYGTTARFLELFGLASLDDLPRTGDLQRL